MNPLVLACDPGTTKSAFCWLLRQPVGPPRILSVHYVDNDMASDAFTAPTYPCERGGTTYGMHSHAVFAFEMIAAMGMAVGASTFETVRYTGRFELRAEQFGMEPHRVYRRDVKLHLCNSMRAKDGNVRQAVMDMYPATGRTSKGEPSQIGTSAKPGPLYIMRTGPTGASGHLWSALAVGITAIAQIEGTA